MAIIQALGIFAVIFFASRLLGVGPFVVDRGGHFADGGGWGDTLRQWLPRHGLTPLGDLSPDDSGQFYAHLTRQSGQLARLQDSAKANKAAIDRLQHVLPSVIHLDLDKNGKPVVSQDFWHALKDRMTKDRDVFTLKRGPDGLDTISDLQWAVLKKRYEKSGSSPGSGKPVTETGLTEYDVQRVARDAVSKSWEDWFSRNEKKVRDMLGDVGPASKASDKAITRLFEEKLKSDKFRNLLVTRDDFVKTLKADLQTQRLESQSELRNLETRLSALMEKLSKMPKVGGPTTKDIYAIAERVATAAIANARLDAAAGKYIGAHWIAELRNQVNFFSPHTGATIDTRFSSPSYQPGRPRVDTRESLSLKPTPGAAHQVAALQRWDENGDCWCAAMHDNQTGPHPATIGVKLAHAVVPKQIVVEHIAASATLDPGAMPRDMDVWAHISEYGHRQALAEWSEAYFGGDAPEGLRRTRADAPAPGRHAGDGLLADRGFVKIAQFTYKDDPARVRPDGTPHIEQLSPDLLHFDAATDNVVVRALTNHGEEYYTCFYRVRLYGEQRDEDVGADPGSGA